jgi:peptidoglycan/LPS O-acetylase OafA/YrhL
MSAIGAPTTRLEILIRWLVAGVGIGGFVLYATHPKIDDPIRKLGMALCVLGTMSNFVLVGVRGRDELNGLPAIELWLLRLGALALVTYGFWHVATALNPAIPGEEGYALAAAVILMALGMILGVVRRARMPKGSQRPPALVLD